MKALCLMFHTDYLVEIKKKKVKDGKIRIGDKDVNVDKVKPFYIKTLFGTMPMYMIKWDSLTPIEPKDFKIYETPVTPEMLKRVVELKIFHFLLKRIAGFELRGGMNILYLIGAIVLGMITMYILIINKLIVI